MYMYIYDVYVYSIGTYNRSLSFFSIFAELFILVRNFHLHAQYFSSCRRARHKIGRERAAAGGFTHWVQASAVLHVQSIIVFIAAARPIGAKTLAQLAINLGFQYEKYENP